MRVAGSAQVRSQDHHSIDTVCQNAGEPGNDAQAENEEQNKAKMVQRERIGNAIGDAR